MHTERDALMRALLEVAFDGTIISEDGVVVEVTQKLLDLSGYTRAEVIGRPVIDFVAEEFRETIQQRQVTGEQGRLEAACVLKNGRRLDVEIVTSRYVIRGRPVRITALRDVSEKRRLERRLHQSQKMEVLGRLASGVAHDFNNVLVVIRMYAELALQELDERNRSGALEILNATDMGAAIAGQVLTYGLQATGEQTPSEVNAVVRRSEQMLKHLVGSDYELVTDLDVAAGTTQVGPGQLQQVLFNLALNARDAMPRGGRIVLRTRSVQVTEAEARKHAPAKPGRYVVIAMSDSGAGIADEVKSRLFEPFFTTKEAGRGTGLGLSVVHGIVERNKGFIVVDSTVGVGTTFAIHVLATDV